MKWQAAIWRKVPSNLISPRQLHFNQSLLAAWATDLQKHFNRFYHSSFNLEMDFQLTRGDREAPLSTAFSQLWNQSSIQLPRLKKSIFLGAPSSTVCRLCCLFLFHRLLLPIGLEPPPQFYSRFDVRLCTELSGTNVSVRAWRLLLLFTLRHRLDVGSLLPSLVLLDFSAHARTGLSDDRLGI